MRPAGLGDRIMGFRSVRPTRSQAFVAIRLRVLGSLSIESDVSDDIQDLIAQPKAMALFVYLVLARPRGFHQRDRLVGLLWPELDQEHARTSLRKTLHRLRQLLGEDAIISQGSESLAATSELIHCDALAFSDAIDAGALRQALDHYTGELLPSFYVPGGGGFEDWLEQERAYYAERAVGAAWKLVERFASENELTNASQLARRVARLSPTDERMLRRVLTMLARLGDRAGAMEVYTRFVDRLWKDYEAKPSAETLQLIEAIRNDAPI
jgi:DNA-binding SARP family transcriptional activator